MSDVTRRPTTDPEMNGGAAPIDGDLWDSGGEFISIPESIVVSPEHGRFRREPLREGAKVGIGTVIGRVAFNGSRSLSVTSQVAGVFLGWLAGEGQSLQRGTPLAHIGVNGAAGNGTVARRRGRASRPRPASTAVDEGAR